MECGSTAPSAGALQHATVNKDYLELPEAPEGEEIVSDYRSVSVTLHRHLLALL